MIEILEAQGCKSLVATRAYLSNIGLGQRKSLRTRHDFGANLPLLLMLSMIYPRRQILLQLSCIALSLVDFSTQVELLS